MSDDWSWFQLLRPDAPSLLASALSASAGEESTGLQIHAGYVPDPGSFDPYATRFAWSRCTFELSGGNLSVISIADSPGHLHVIHGSRTLERLLRDLDLLTRNPWLWIDFFVSRRYDAMTDAGSFAAAVWKDMLEPLAGWLDCEAK